MDVINVMDIVSSGSETKKNRSTSNNFLKNLFSSAGDDCMGQDSRRITLLLRLCGIDTKYGDKIHQKIFCSKFAVIYLLCFSYLFTLRIVSLWMYRRNDFIIHISATFVTAICFSVWLSVQIQSNKIVALLNDLTKTIQKDDLARQMNFSSRLLFLSLALAFTATGIDIVTQFKDGLYRKYYQFGSKIYSSSLSILVVGLGLTTNVYCDFVMPILLLFVNNFLSECICCTLESFRKLAANRAVLAVPLASDEIDKVRPQPTWNFLRTNLQSKIIAPNPFTMRPAMHFRTPVRARLSPCVKSAASVNANSTSIHLDIDAMFYQHKVKLNVVQQLKNTFAIPLFIMFTKQFFNLFLFLTLLIYHANVIGNPDREAKVACHMLHSTFSLVGTIILSSRIPSTQQSIKDTYRNIYEDRIYFKRVENYRDSRLLRVMIDREVIHMSAGNIFDISNRNILTFFGVFVTYAALMITDVLQLDRTACVSVGNDTSID